MYPCIYFWIYYSILYTLFLSSFSCISVLLLLFLYPVSHYLFLCFTLMKIVENFPTIYNCSRDVKHQNYFSTDVCSICLEDGYMVKLSCDHFFHKHCINKWLHHKNTCPLCRQKVHKKPAHYYFCSTEQWRIEIRNSMEDYIEIEM